MASLYRARVEAVLRGLAPSRQKQGKPFQTGVAYDLQSVLEQIKLRAAIESVSFHPYSIEGREPGCGIQGKVEVFHEIGRPYEATPRHAKVFYDQGMNTCWQRFVICKELCQLLWLEDHLMIKSEADLIALAERLTLGAQQENLIPTMWTERVSIRAALHILCPLEEREELFQSGKNLKEMDLATMYRIPRVWANAIFDRQLHDLLKRDWEQS